MQQESQGVVLHCFAMLALSAGHVTEKLVDSHKSRVIRRLDFVDYAVCRNERLFCEAIGIAYVFFLIVDGGINAQQIGRQQNFTYQKERAAGYGSPFLLVF